jgi:hypothetical protein
MDLELGAVRWQRRCRRYPESPDYERCPCAAVDGSFVSQRAGQILAQALATTTNPARPGQVVQFTVSVTNRISAARAVYLYYDVPQFTTSEGDPAWTTFAYNIGNVAAGATKSMTLSFTVLSGTQAPPNGFRSSPSSLQTESTVLWSPIHWK